MVKANMTPAALQRMLPAHVRTSVSLGGAPSHLSLLSCQRFLSFTTGHYENLDGPQTLGLLMMLTESSVRALSGLGSSRTGRAS